ncbi:MAG: hypothetical protein ACRCX2_30265 [Paraclostridium sp.]
MAREIRLIFSDKENDLKEYLETKSSSTFYLKELLRNDMNSNKEFAYLLRKNEEMMISVVDKISDAIKQIKVAPHGTIVEPQPTPEPIEDKKEYSCKLDASDLMDLMI